MARKHAILSRNGMRILAAGLVLPVLALAAPSARPTPADSKVAAVVRRLLSSIPSNQGLWVACERIRADSDLVAFYRNRQFAPVWVGARGPKAVYYEAVQVLSEGASHGFHPEEYHLSCLRAASNHFRRLLSQGREPELKALAEQEIVLTDAFMTYGSHLLAGKVDPEKLYPEWLSERSKADVLAVLGDLSAHQNVGRAIRELAPPHDDYWRMVRAAGALRKIAEAGGWPPLAFKKVLRRGMRDRHVPLLRKRLEMSGDLAAERGGRADRFDSALEQAVRRFQARHGLTNDGIVGRETKRELNVPAWGRWRQLQLNLERWRWLPHTLGERYLMVNTASFSLRAFDGGQQPLTMRVIVGEQYRKTPVFSQVMRYLELNPYWNVPLSIAMEELLPEIRKDPGYLKANQYELLSGWEASSRVLDPLAIQWEAVDETNFPGRIRQSPGPRNALGRIKFMFPNRFYVYLHDTPGKHLFSKNNRALSHGCIRVEHPVDLALFVLQDDPSWNRRYLEELIAGGERHVIPLPTPTVVHLLYWTAWVTEEGELQFRRDVYDRDPVLWEALNKLPEQAVEVSEGPRSPREPGASSN